MMKSRKESIEAVEQAAITYAEFEASMCQILDALENPMRPLSSTIDSLRRVINAHEMYAANLKLLEKHLLERAKREAA